MNTKNRTTRTSTDVQLTPISNTEWRVSDVRVPWDSAFSLIGFISMNAGTYEVLEFGDPMRTFFVGSMAKAESKFVQHAGRLDERLTVQAIPYVPIRAKKVTMSRIHSPAEDSPERWKHVIDPADSQLLPTQPIKIILEPNPPQSAR